MFPSIITMVRFVWLQRSTAAQQRIVLSTIAQSAAYGLPLATMLECLAMDETGFHANRVRRLVYLLRSGDSLPVALEKVPEVVPEGAPSQIRLGVESGSLERATRSAIASLDRQPHDAFAHYTEAATHMAWSLLVMTFIVAFIVIKIVPTLTEIFSDFEVALPPTMRLLILIADFAARYAALFVCGAVGIYLWTRFGGLRRSLRKGVVSRLLSPLFELDTPELLRQIAWTRRGGKPLAGVISTLARCHDHAGTRHKLLFVRNEMEQGVDVWTALQGTGVINPNESRAIRGSEILDNTPWILEELADCREGRTHWRVGLLSRLLPPMMVLILAGFVALVAISMMSCLTTLVLSL